VPLVGPGTSKRKQIRIDVLREGVDRRSEKTNKKHYYILVNGDLAGEGADRER